MISFKYLNPKHILDFIADLYKRPVEVSREDLHNAYISVFKESVNGRIVLEHLAKIHFVGRSTLSREVRKSDHNEGRRYVVESIIHTINNDIKTLEKMNQAIQKESESEEE